MAFGSFRDASFVVTVLDRSYFDEHWLWREDDDVPLWRLSEALTHLEYTYNVLALTDVFSQGYGVPLHQIVEDPFPGGRGIDGANQFLTRILPPASFLLVRDVRVGSLHIHVAGIADVIRVVLSIFDPIWWRERAEMLRQARQINRRVNNEAAEQLRHEIAMNLIEEEASAQRVIMDKLEKMVVLSDFLDRRTRLHGRLEEEREALIGYTYREIGRIVRSLEQNRLLVSSEDPPELDS